MGMFLINKKWCFMQSNNFLLSSNLQTVGIIFHPAWASRTVSGCIYGSGWTDPCSDNELKTWLSGYPADDHLFNPIQIHLTANPQFRDGAGDVAKRKSAC
jgi:hypothetical protein